MGYRNTTETKIDPPTEKDYALARSAFAWMESLVDSKEAENSDYLWNLSIYGKCGVVNSKGLGLVASAVSSYQRREADKAEKADLTKSVHIGEVGARLSVKVRILACRPTQYGFMTKMVTAEGNVVAAWGRPTHLEGDKKGQAVEVNDELWIKGTIKKLGEYQGVKETQLNRADGALDPTVEKANKKAATAANKRIEKAAGELECDGVKYPVFDIVRANGELVGWCVRMPGKKGAVLYKDEYYDKTYAEALSDEKPATMEKAREEIRDALAGSARQAFGDPKILVTFLVVALRNGPLGSDEYRVQSGESDYLIVQLAADQFVLRTRPQWDRGHTAFKTFAEAEAEAAEMFTRHTYRFVRAEGNVWRASTWVFRSQGQEGLPKDAIIATAEQLKG